MTSSPGPIPIASRTITSASVPFATPTARLTPRYAAASSSKARTFGPRMNSDDSRTASNRLRSSSVSGPYCAATSTSGIFGTASHPRRAAMTPDPGNDHEHDRCGDDVFGVPEAVVEVLPARSGGPADPGERERPGDGPRDREQRVAAQRHAEDAGLDGDEGADHGCHPADCDRVVAEALEPALAAVERVRRHVEPAAVTLEVRPSGVVPVPPPGD